MKDKDKLILAYYVPVKDIKENIKSHLSEIKNSFNFDDSVIVMLIPSVEINDPYVQVLSHGCSNRCEETNNDNNIICD